jgi:putative hemolysin
VTAARHVAISLRDAVDRAPTLARLSRMAAQSALRLRIVQPMLPAGLRELVRAGPIDEASWCLLVPHNAAAAKLRQLIPALLSCLQAAGHPVGAIRVKVERAAASGGIYREKS